MSFCGNDEEYSFIKGWIVHQFEKTETKISLDNFLFVTGNSGIGKTYSIQKICQELQLHVVNLNTNNCSSSAELTDNLVKTTTSSLLQVLTNDCRKKIIVIDEFESMMAIDRTINTTLLNILMDKKLKRIPIICISSIEIVKKIGTIKKKCQIIELKNPSDKEVFSLLKSIYPDRKDDFLKDIVDNSHGHLSQCLQKMNNKFFDNTFDKVDEIRSINYLYGNDFNRQDIINILANDPWLIPLRFHENLIKELSIRKSTIKKNHEFYVNFMNRLLFFDILMFKNTIDIACDLFTSSIYNLTLMPLKSKAKSDISSFTKMLSYLSLKKKYIKKSYSTNFPLYQISNYHINIIGRKYIFFN
jgi:nucleoside-triphosphatase THEP1